MLGRKLIQSYLDLCNYYEAQDKDCLSFEDKPYSLFLEILYQEVKDSTYFDDDIYIMTVDDHIQTIDSIPSTESANQQLESLIQIIHKNFDINKEDHFIIFPLQGAELQEDIQFSDFYFLAQKEEKELILQISRISGIELKEVEAFLTHTKTSRSPDFLRSPIVIVKVLQQSTYVNQRAARIAQKIILFINTLYLAENLGPPRLRLRKANIQENSHVAVLAAQNWRRCHKAARDIKLRCDMDIDFLHEENYQDKFILLYDAFEVGIGFDELTEKFVNALILFNKGIQQYQYNRDKTLALLLFFSSAESLIAEDYNEKRLRLAAVISRIAKIDSVSEFELATVINDLYIKRNDFVHAGKSAYFDYEDKSFYILEHSIAQLVLLYLDFDSLILKEKEEKRITAWKKYIDTIFKQIIFGAIN